MKFIEGGIGTTDDSKWMDIIVKSALPCRAKDLLIGSGIIITGVGYLLCCTFRHGAKAFEVAEHNTMVDVGIFKDPNVKKLDVNDMYPKKK